ncbi:MAG: hypothetical protein EOO63_16720 [Hymenobacter sp.]|nr:MAG: hypothetical protein EOO63_16720 [Hymenobacter sp.]
MQRLVTVEGRQVDSARAQYKAGLDLRELTVSQQVHEPFPLFIPLRTADFPLKEGVLPLRWAAVDATHVKERLLTGPIAAPKFATPQAVRAFLRVADTCRLLAVLNAQDKILERLWALPDRIGRFQQLKDYGFELSTGASFSVVERTTEDTLVPRFHNLVMQRRHQRLLSEIQQAGLDAVPNLYWLDEREADRWVEWLGQNPTVRYVSREFTRTRQGDSVKAIVESLLRLLGRTTRTYHVFLVGLGPATAAYALQRLAIEGHTGTIITSDPIMQAVYGKRYNGNFKALYAAGSVKEKVALKNIESLETYLLDAVAGTAISQYARRNLVLS